MNTNIELDVAALEKAISDLLVQMDGHDCASDEYATMADQLVKLYKAKETHVSLKLKEIDTKVKRDETAATIQVKLTESQLKENETEANIRAKDFDSRLKEEDLELRKAESELTCRTKELDAILKQREIDRPWLPSNDTLAIIAANLVGIAAIIGYERANVIASKALGFVSKLR